MPQLTIDVNARLTMIRISATDTPPRMLLQGVLEEPAGRVIREFSEDVTDLLTPTQKGYLTALVNRAQTWLDAKAAG